MNIITDCTTLVCRPDTPISDVIRRIDESSPMLFQIVADISGKVVGTVTDGDVRRGFARGLRLEDPVGECMHSPPIIGYCDDETVSHLLYGRRFLPVCHRDGRLSHLAVENLGPRRVEQAMVMSGGLGTRLGERTKTTPKPLLEVGGRPLLEHILTRLEDYGIKRVYVSVHYLADQIRAFIDQRDSRCEVSVVQEEEPLGTAGSLSLVDWPTSAPILTMNADVLTDVDLNALIEHHLRMGCAGTVAASRHEYQVPFGVLRFDENEILHGIDEKPTFYHLVSAGIYYLEPSIVALLPKGQRVDMPVLLQDAVQRGLRLTVFPVHEYWSDVGRPDDLASAELFHAKRNC